MMSRFLVVPCFLPWMAAEFAAAANCSEGAACTSPGANLLQKKQMVERLFVEQEEEEDEVDASDPEATCETLCPMTKLGKTPSSCTLAKNADDCWNGFYKQQTKITLCKWGGNGKCVGGKISLNDCNVCADGTVCPTCGATSSDTSSESDSDDDALSDTTAAETDELPPFYRLKSSPVVPNSDRTESKPCETKDVPIIFDRFRFVTKRTRNPTANVHLAELEFQDADGNALVPLKMSNPEGRNPKGTDAMKAMDGRTVSQWNDRLKTPLIVIFKGKVQPAKFRFVTANDEKDQDPVQWVLEARLTEGWMAVHEQKTDFETPTKRQTATEWFTLKASVIGQECMYECDDGFVQWGRHIYQSYSTQGLELVHEGFEGGHCEPLCSGATTCQQGEKAVRYRTDNKQGGFCLSTECFEDKDALLKELARGNYEMWNYARNPKTGLYVDSMQVLKPDATWWNNGNTGMGGLGMIVECIGHAMGFVDTKSAQNRVLLTLNSLTGNTKGVKVPRKDLGMFSGLLNTNDGSVGTGPGQLGNNAFLMSGILFQRTYWQHADPRSKKTKEIVKLSHALFDSVEWAKILCTDGKLDSNGKDLPFLVQDGGICQNVHEPGKTGLYEVDELYIAVWLMYYHTCHGYAEGECPNKAIEKLWQGHQGRRLHPDHELFGNPIVLDWGSYTVQLNYYLSGAFNSDPYWQNLFSNQYTDELAFLKSHLYYGDEKHYGLGAGPTMKRCAGTSYIADRLWDEAEKPTWSPNCRTWSPYAVAGYMPVNPEVISDQLSDMMETGEAVTTFMDEAGERRFILNRRSLLYVDFEPYQTMVDISEEMFGLSFYFLGQEWWNKNTDYFGVLAAKNSA